MTAFELMGELKELGPQDLAVTLKRLADAIYGAELNGHRATDAIDFKMYFDELAEAARVMHVGEVG